MPNDAPLPRLSDMSTVLSFCNLSQYHGFARYLHGENKTLKLENDVISLDLSSKGGIISRAELKKYDSYRGGKVVVINGDDDIYSFVLTEGSAVELSSGCTRLFMLMSVESTVTYPLTVLPSVDRRICGVLSA